MRYNKSVQDITFPRKARRFVLTEAARLKPSRSARNTLKKEAQPAFSAFPQKASLLPRFGT
jgi:hypothetical protein